MPDKPLRWGDPRTSTSGMPNEAWQAKRDARQTLAEERAAASVSKPASASAPSPDARPARDGLVASASAHPSDARPARDGLSSPALAALRDGADAPPQGPLAPAAEAVPTPDHTPTGVRGERFDVAPVANDLRASAEERASASVSKAPTSAEERASASVSKAPTSAEERASASVSKPDPFALAALVRPDFPIFERVVNGYPLAYLDSANTSQKPRVVVDAIADHYLHHNANVARAMHTLGGEASAAFEGGRRKVAAFIGGRPEEVVFTKNASEALNLAAHTLTQHLRLGPGDEVVVSVLEHHSNIVPWQLACERSGATLRWFDITDDGRLDLAKAAEQGLINERTRVVSIAWVSNVLGTILPVADIAAQAHAVGATVVVDASQAVQQFPTDVTATGADLVAFTGHKLLGPTGIGVLWGRYDLLEALPPFLGGGEMIEVVTMERTTFAQPPMRFEAGTPPIAQSVGLGAAIDYLTALGMERVEAHEQAITAYALERLQAVDGLRILGPTEAIDRGGAVSFTVTTASGLEVHPHDLMQLLDAKGVAVRGGHHCARPLHKRLGVQASTRASFYLYSTPDEVDRLIEAITYARDFFEGV